jgi:membrane protein
MPPDRIEIMKNIRQLMQQLEQALSNPREEFGRFTRFIFFQIELWRFCVRRLRENNVMAMGAALSFRTIFAMIPVLALALLVMKSVGALEDSRAGLHRFLEASGFTQIITVQETQPATDTAPGESPPGEIINVADRIEEVVDNVSSKLTFQRIGPVGGALLIWTALTLLTTMEESLNRIFGARSDRSTPRRVLLYWSTMTLGPIVLAVASYLGQRTVDTVRGAPGASWLIMALGWVGPIVVGVIVLALVYALLPNTSVRFQAAVGGAAVAVPLWLVAKWGFSLYVRNLVAKGNIYGVLGLLPLFLMWLNLSWWIFLFGAQLAHTAANLSEMRMAERAGKLVLGPSDLLAAALAIARNYQAGQGPMTRDAMTAVLNLPADAIQSLIDRLDAGGLLIRVDREAESGYLLSKPPNQLAVLDVISVGDPRGSTSASAECDEQIAAAIAGIRARTRSPVEGLTLSDLLDQPAKA